MVDERYGIEDLARLGGVSRRTIRYYVQEGLLPAASGAGRGAHYGAEHLARLLRLKALQESGLTLEDARGALDAPAPRPLAHHTRHGYRREWTAHADHASPYPAAERATSRVSTPVARSAWTRVEILPGVEIHVSGSRRLPSPARLVELAEWCRTHFAATDPDER